MPSDSNFSIAFTAKFPGCPKDKIATSLNNFYNFTLILHNSHKKTPEFPRALHYDLK